MKNITIETVFWKPYISDPAGNNKLKWYLTFEEIIFILEIRYNILSTSETKNFVNLLIDKRRYAIKFFINWQRLSVKVLENFILIK